MKTPQNVLDSNRRWRIANREHMTAYKRAWRATHREKSLAHRAVQNAVRTGAIIKPDACEICCVKGLVSGHHHNGYAERLDVVWLCHSCHSDANLADHPDYRPGGV